MDGFEPLERFERHTGFELRAILFPLCRHRPFPPLHLLLTQHSILMTCPVFGVHYKHPPISMTRGTPWCIVEVCYIVRDLRCPERDGPMAAKKRPTRHQPPKSSSASRVPQPLPSDALVYTEYDITDEPLENRDIKKLPGQVQARLDELYELALHHPTQAIPELEQLIATYPHMPMFFNSLRGCLETKPL